MALAQPKSTEGDFVAAFGSDTGIILALFRMIQLNRLNLSDVPWQRLDAFHDRVVFQTKPWLDFLCASQGGHIIVAEVKEQNEVIGYFSGVLVRKAGFGILGSSFPGWATPYIGFNLLPGYSRAHILPAFERWAFNEL